MPIAQLEQTLAPDPEYVPVAQFAQLARVADPLVETKVPAAQLEQPVAPLDT